MTSMTLSGTETSTGAPSRHHGGATALTNTTWLAAQQRKATHQPFQPRPLKMVANLEGKTTPRAPLVSRHAIGNVPAAAPATAGARTLAAAVRSHPLVVRALIMAVGGGRAAARPSKKKWAALHAGGAAPRLFVVRERR